MKLEDKNWVLENYYRRLIVDILMRGEKTEKEIEKEFKITLSPYLSNYKPKVQIKISSTSLKNHLNLLLREGIVKKEKNRYRLFKSE